MKFNLSRLRPLNYLAPYELSLTDSVPNLPNSYMSIILTIIDVLSRLILYYFLNFFLDCALSQVVSTILSINNVLFSVYPIYTPLAILYTPHLKILKVMQFLIKLPFNEKITKLV